MYFDETNNYFDIISNSQDYDIDKSNYSYNDIDVSIDSINFNDLLAVVYDNE